MFLKWVAGAVLIWVVCFVPVDDAIAGKLVFNEAPSSRIGVIIPVSLTRRLHLRSEAAVIVDQKTGRVLYGKNMQEEAPIASITKLMTAMVTLDAGLPLDQMLTVTEADVDTLRHSASRLPVGTTLSRRQMLQLALMSSENRAASSLARNYPGGLPAFVDAMNQKARELGMWHTHFVEGTGLNDQDVSTPEDLAKMVNAAYHYPLIRQITTTSKYRVSYAPHRFLNYLNSDILVRSRAMPIGLSKTGFINEAGHCLVLQTRVYSHPVIMVFLNSWGEYTRAADALRARRWLESLDWRRVVTKEG
ncbi:MAG: D-alanyl-D-alanine endopeptidase [Proteobacteria bacterium]|nr:D-alanyl-D-alanine endopeptidase [Pseudomonadota bacterium]